jgi:hypothetical protein
LKEAHLRRNLCDGVRRTHRNGDGLRFRQITQDAGRRLELAAAIEQFPYGGR